MTLLAAYLFGAIPFGFLVARARGVDILRLGSGNIGATNVGRVLGRRFGILVFLLDFLKGAIPAGGAKWIANLDDSGLPLEGLPVAAGLASLLGHLFPIYLRFRGGKGVATGAGVVSVLLPLPALGALLVWATLVCATRYVSLASVAAAGSLVLFRLLSPAPFTGENAILTGFCMLAAMLVLVRHRTNLQRLIHGTENRLRETPTMSLFARILHVLAVGLWFGSLVFFTFVVGLELFSKLPAKAESEDRPAWLPLSEPFRKDPQSWGPDGTALFKDAKEVRREQGTRVAGFAISPMFDWYFLIQGICALIALVTAIRWNSLDTADRPHWVRVKILIVALLTVVIGWLLEVRVSNLRKERNDKVDLVLSSSAPTNEQLQQAAELVQDFKRWHLYSMFLNLATILLVSAAMVLSASLPHATGESTLRGTGRRESVASTP